MALQAYSVVLKKKVPMNNVHIAYAKGNYMASGKDKDGRNLFLFMSEKDAKAAVKAGHAKKGTGFK